jgi:hypothetical protein
LILLTAPTSNSYEPRLLPKSNLNSPLFLLAVMVPAGVVCLMVGSYLNWTSEQLFWRTLGTIVVAWFYAQGVQRQFRRRQPKPWQLEVVPEPEGNWVSRKSFEKVCFTLKALKSTTVKEDVVNLIARRSGYYLFSRMAPWALLAGVLLVFAASNLAIKYPTTEYVRHRQGKGKNAEISYVSHTVWHDLHFGRLMLFLAVIALCCMIYKYIAWAGTVVMITSINLKPLFLPPVWLPFLPAKTNQNFKLRTIDLTENEDTPMGNMLGYGGISGGTQLQEDEALRHLKWLPKPDKVLEILEDAIEYARRNNL